MLNDKQSLPAAARGPAPSEQNTWRRHDLNALCDSLDIKADDLITEANKWMSMAASDFQRAVIGSAMAVAYAIDDERGRCASIADAEGYGIPIKIAAQIRKGG